MLTLTGVDQVVDAVGRELGAGSWFDLDQPVIDGFAEVTGDDQWIHVDLDAAREGRSARRSPTGI
ncbi:hypothetical protein GCM10025867_00980 [Frondihabitans sucicola]|uniref:MaoC-like domain-containing protein n=1 Tax=Frondihabitans sucicola TaxID=1268041 RepID=A0ABM8GHM7_9MICO|nr:MaoC/PaaZ C-terminal domain-containing protein [Frondihabitans sucicola]BDZ47857.1 hypothetical protein GCM10025867_00980 [Frondihabitans sucicola]